MQQMADVDAETVEFVRRIRARFPNEAKRTDVWLAERGRDPSEHLHMWVEAFADRTTEAVRSGDWALVHEHTSFVSNLLHEGSEAIRKLVDVSYAENLMWNLEQSMKIKAWPHIDPSIRHLYEQMWGRFGNDVA
jgi:hypothetical protein